MVNGEQQQDLVAQNQSFLAMASRRIREEIALAQKRRADGWLNIGVHFTSGVMDGPIHYKPDWIERLSR